MKTPKEIKTLSKKQREFLNSVYSVGMPATYKADLIAQLNAFPKPEPEKIFWIENMLRLIDERERNPPKWYFGCLKVVLLIVGIPLLIFIAATIEKSDLFQKTINPEKYWRIQVAMLEQNIHDTELYIKDWEDYSERKNNGVSIDYDSYVRRLIIEGEEPDEAKRIASKDIKEIDEAKKSSKEMISKARIDILRSSAISLKNYKEKLKQAKNELAKYQ